jgi:hypothetical protein
LSAISSAICSISLPFWHAVRDLADEQVPAAAFLLDLSSSREAERAPGR